VHGCAGVRTCVQVGFHELEDEVDVSVVLSFEHVQQAAVTSRVPDGGNVNGGQACDR
jgi:hypothetical protein